MTATAKKISGLTFNEAGTAVTGGVAAEAGFMDHLKQGFPLIKDTDVAIVGSDTTRTMSELGVLALTMYAGEKLQPVARVRQATGL